MRIKRRNAVRPAFLYHAVERLDDHLTKAFGSAHDIGRVHSLVGADQNEAFTAVMHGSICCFICTDRIVLDGLARAVLHQGDVLVRRRVIHYIRPVPSKDLLQSLAVADGANQRDQIQLRILVLQLHLDRIGIVLIDIEDDQRFRIIRSDLAAKLAADRSAAAGDHDGLSSQKAGNLRHIGLDRVAPKQILDGHIFHRADRDSFVCKLIDARKDLQLASRLVANTQDVAAVRSRCRGNGKINLIDSVFFYIEKNIISASDNRYAVDKAIPFIGVIIDDADDFFIAVCFCHIAEDHL